MGQIKEQLPCRIVLVGFSGCGKSTIGKKIARKLNYSFLDTDGFFETKYHISVFDCFKKYGEETFRRCEYEILKESLEAKQAVIATGGGAPCFFNAMELINRQAFSIYIKMSNASLLTRLLSAKKERPLTQGQSKEVLLDYITNTMLIREPFYNKAHFIVKGESIDLKNVIAQLVPFQNNEIVTKTGK
ncbi:MAG: shikimate kinase [Bacteroidales bacterium]